MLHAHQHTGGLARTDLPTRITQGMNMRGTLSFLGMQASVAFGMSASAGVSFDAFFDTSEFSRVSRWSH